MNAIFAWFMGLVTALVPGFGGNQPTSFSGYVDADYVYVSPTSGGIIAKFPAREGQEVKQGDLLFAQTNAQESALADAAVAQANSAQASWQNLTTGGRAEELAASAAAVNKAEADLNLAQTNLARSQKLYASNTITRAQLDQDTATVQSAEAALNQAKALFAVTGLPGREQQQRAAEAAFHVAEANADKAKADLADRTVVAPVDGRVERTYYDLGEMAPAGLPVLSLLPADALKVDFYVGEPDRMSLRIGQQVEVSCDGCDDGLTATVSFMASDPQYTSPIIYSREERNQLVFLAEARLNQPGHILPGQPVTVSLSP